MDRPLRPGLTASWSLANPVLPRAQHKGSRFQEYGNCSRGERGRQMDESLMRLDFSISAYPMSNYETETQSEDRQMEYVRGYLQVSHRP